MGILIFSTTMRLGGCSMFSGIIVCSVLLGLTTRGLGPAEENRSASVSSGFLAVYSQFAYNQFNIIQ